MARFLADANIEARLTAWLRQQKHDVLAAAETAAREEDEILLSKARQENRILITSDKDFGELVFLQKKLTSGIVLLRFRTEDTLEKIRHLEMIWNKIEPSLQGHFTVVNERNVRIRPL